MIGSPADMKNLIINTTDQGNLEVLDLRTAVEREVVYPSQLGPPTPGENKTLDKEMLRPTRRRTPGFLQVLDDLRDAAPNLALNVENSTAPTRELWLWALLGVALQLAAMMLPGMATYYWKWEKGGNPTAPYGYPCFLIGTSLVVVGVMTCGHVIEGTTAEQHFDFVSSAQGPRRMQQIVRLQRSCTVGDQHFPSYAIYNSPGNLTLRTSRLSQRNYSSVALIATAATVAGFIVQFIGLRALHWSATIMQLGVTLLMTGVRAYVRRGLAGNPVSHELLEGHEVACLTLGLLRRDFNKEDWPSTPQLPPIWEVQTLHCNSELSDNERPSGYDRYWLEHRLRDLGLGMDGSNLFLFKFWLSLSPLLTVEPLIERLIALFTAPDLTALSTLEHSLAFDSANELPVSEALGLHESIHKLVPQHDHATNIAEKLAKAIEALAVTFAKTPLWWKKADNDDNRPFKTTAYKWCVPVTARIYPNAKTTSAACFEVEQGPSANPWVLRQRSRLHSMLALWLYTLDERTRAVGRLNLHFDSFRGRGSPHALRVSEEQYSLRVVARDRPGVSAAAVQACVLESWLGKKVYSAHSRPEFLYTNETGHRPWPVFGAFLSTFAL
jgi:hypothetical protein